MGSLASAALTAASTLVVSAFAAIVGVVIAREFGRTDETDGFFAAYGVFIVITLAAQSIRIAVLPALAQPEERRLTQEVAGSRLPSRSSRPLLRRRARRRSDASLHRGQSEVAQEAASNSAGWSAAVAHLFAGLAAGAAASTTAGPPPSATRPEAQRGSLSWRASGPTGSSRWGET
jgi:hypothetical protein